MRQCAYQIRKEDVMSNVSKMEIVQIEVGNIQPNEFNPNKMPPSTFKKMIASIKKFGLFNPIIVRRYKHGNYQIVDGEWRWRAFQEMKLKEISCRVIEATDEEVKQMIFATKITGRHNAYDSQNVLRDIMGGTTETMDACNLDKLKLERKTKYMNFDKGRRLKKDSRDLKDEADGLPPNSDYKCVFAVTLSKQEYEFVITTLKKYNTNLGKALMSILERC